MLRLVDMFTDATCQYSADVDKLPAAKLMDGLACGMQADKERCELDGGHCVVGRDGYYVVNMMCVVFGTITFLWFIRPKVLQLQKLSLKAWRLPAGK